ncbi:putative phosphoric monoester hydrolase [Rosa chinensis]|uniref:Putative phosphoric monoester hydrolase n=1 Tax=Rosa chinensis TaxID=74649 RepID=A0A2P6RVG3_ROSCH|nr:putative phosphoric monoester hydrolase [Rosa chinensis]
MIECCNSFGFSIARELKLKIKPSYNYFVATQRAVSHLKLDCLLEGEQVEVEGYGVALINTDEAGTLIVTNFRLLFLSEELEMLFHLAQYLWQQLRSSTKWL